MYGLNDQKEKSKLSFYCKGKERKAESAAYVKYYVKFLFHSTELHR